MTPEQILIALAGGAVGAGLGTLAWRAVRGSAKSCCMFDDIPNLCPEHPDFEPIAPEPPTLLAATQIWLTCAAESVKNGKSNEALLLLFVMLETFMGDHPSGKIAAADIVIARAEQFRARHTKPAKPEPDATAGNENDAV